MFLNVLCTMGDSLQRYCGWMFVSLILPSLSRLTTQNVVTLEKLTQRWLLVFPSEIAEPLFKKFVIDHSKSITQEGVFSRSYQPAERAGSIEDMAGLVMYMTSRAGAFLNGSVMLADGGKLATMPATYWSGHTFAIRAGKS